MQLVAETECEIPVHDQTDVRPGAHEAREGGVPERGRLHLADGHGGGRVRLARQQRPLSEALAGPTVPTTPSRPDRWTDAWPESRM